MDTPQGAFSPFFPSQEAVKQQKMGLNASQKHQDHEFPREIPSTSRTNPSPYRTD